MGLFAATIEVSTEAFDLIFKGATRIVAMPGYTDSWDERLTSRFLAKIALEATATRLVSHDGGLHYLATEAQFDPIRKYARQGCRNVWPYHSRRIYAADKTWPIADGEEVERVWEFHTLCTEAGELYFVLALFDHQSRRAEY